MKEETQIYFFRQSEFDLRPIGCGHRFCPADFVRPYECNTGYYLLHFIDQGAGNFYKDGVMYHLVAGDVFLTKPDEVFRYESDGCMHYIWIKFRGKCADVLMSLGPLVRADATAFRNIASRSPDEGGYEEYITGELYRILSSLIKGQTSTRDYVGIIKSYIHESPRANVSVGELQKYTNLNRQYMTTLFHRVTGMSIQEYITRVRIDKAKVFLGRGFSVSECAEISGYASVYAFSKAFKRVTGKSPRQYLKER